MIENIQALLKDMAYTSQRLAAGKGTERASTLFDLQLEALSKLWALQREVPSEEPVRPVGGVSLY